MVDRLKPYQLSTHRNGLQILRVPRPGTEAVTVQFFFRVGGRHETPATNGLAHFTEHMVFKGGKRYQTAIAIADAINRVGGYTNAYTSEEITSFYVKLAADKPQVALDVLSDYLTTPTFDAAELEKERGVIIEEINRYADDPAAELGHLMAELEYPKHPLGRPILGPKRNIRRFPRSVFVDWIKTHYTPDRTILAVTGNLSRIDQPTLDRFVGRFTGSSTATADPAPTAGHRALGVKHKKTEQSHLAVSLKALPYADRDQSTILDVLSMILGGNMSSRLFHEVREKQGLCYTIYSSPEQYLDDGSLYIYAGVPNDKVVKALRAIKRELVRLRDGDLSAADLKIGKESLKGTRALRWEDSSSLGTLYALQQLMLGSIETTPQILERIDRVTKRQVVELAGKLVKDENLTVGVVGPQRQDDFAKELSF